MRYSDMYTQCDVYTCVVCTHVWYMHGVANEQITIRRSSSALAASPSDFSSQTHHKLCGVLTKVKGRLTVSQTLGTVHHTALPCQPQRP